MPCIARDNDRVANFFRNALGVLIVVAILAAVLYPIYTSISRRMPSYPDIRCRVNADGDVIMSWPGGEREIDLDNIRAAVASQQYFNDSREASRRAVVSEAKRRLRKARKGDT